ncbi:MAG: SAM-dependent methyltransferase [Deltaproteobacteria bacterium]|nr:SAM-dependent methyltransferase [Deltaproteobacteria bacterium]
MPDPKTDSGALDRGSFRDPSGFVFEFRGEIHRQVNVCYRDDYERLMGSGLYAGLTEAGLLIPHAEADASLACSPEAFRVIRPEPISFISYPYEWCFGQLRDAALATLEIQRRALDFGMQLKDASAYNIQFRRCRPVLIDTLSFERHEEGRPWVAYRQFCQHFLAPLLLMSHRDVRLGQLLRVYLDGIPLDLTARLLPWFRSHFSFAILAHVRLHARSQSAFADRRLDSVTRKMSKHALLGLVDNLQAAIGRLCWKAGPSTWGGYYTEEHSYSNRGLEHKLSLVREYLERISPARVWDLGANTGLFSRVAAELGIPTLAFDFDPLAVELHYRQCRQEGSGRILPLLLDLTNPSPALGWENRERKSIWERGPADCIMALALVHHLAIANNVPLPMLAGFFAGACRTLIVEFVPKTDPQTQRLLASREDIFPGYTLAGFESAFGRHFETLRSEPIEQSERRLYLMQRR